MEKFSVMKFISALCSIGERQGRGEAAAKLLICDALALRGVRYSTQEFETYLPKVTSARLTADGTHVHAVATSFVSGSISSSYNLISSLISSQKNLYDANVNFNPRCGGISRSNHYFAPALAVSKEDVPSILSAESVRGRVTVKKVPHVSANVLVGNFKNPELLVFCHYDSISTGASDNASGVAVVLNCIFEDPASLGRTGFVIAGNEELSYDEPVYWGHGYRVFEARHSKLLRSCKKIVVVDSLGTGPTELEPDPRLMNLAFPLKNIREYAQKCAVLCGEFDSLMGVYHSDLDIPEKLKTKYLKRASSILLSTVR